MRQKFAIPLKEGVLCSHFGHCEQFAIIESDQNEIVNESYLTPPPHEPGLLPQWLSEKGVTHIIAGGIGERAINLFKDRDIKVFIGAPLIGAKELVKKCLNNNLEDGENRCDH